MNRPRLFGVKFPFGLAGLRLGLLLVVPIGVCPVRAAGQGPGAAETAVVFYADRHTAEPMWGRLFEAFRAEVAEERQEYPLPEDFMAVRASELKAGQEFADVIEVRLIGRCDVAEQAYRALPKGPLGWVVRASGEIQPFIYVDCGRLAQYLGPAALGMNEDQRRSAMGRAISRVAIHEWIHIETQSARHESKGIGQAELNSRELTGSRIPGGR
ncbi:MAG: hypothetical protein JOZ83_06050 [Silvibacterium sp.]|nr:hypothetical protein [Silvibacterium sp.]